MRAKGSCCGRVEGEEWDWFCSERVLGVEAREIFDGESRKLSVRRCCSGNWEIDLLMNKRNVGVKGNVTSKRTNDRGSQRLPYETVDRHSRASGRTE